MIHLINEYHTNIYQAKYWKNEDESEWIIVSLNRRGNKVLGMQTRNLKEGKRRSFKIYNYENLLEWVSLGKDLPEQDITELVKRAGDHEDSTYRDLNEATQNNAQRMMDLLPEEVRKELIQEQIRKALAK